jgi:hypothetical protein
MPREAVSARFGEYMYLRFAEVAKHITDNPKKSKTVFRDLYLSDKN